MKAPRELRTRARSAVNCLIFFLLIALTVTASLIVYELVESAWGERRGAVAVSMLAVIFFLALACTVIDSVRRRISVDRPVGKILAATERIASGDFSVRLTPTHSWARYDEYDVIMDNLNMVAEELGKSELLKTDFISNVSHELKTPISVIKSYAELIAREELEEDERRRAAETIASAGGRLSALVTNILKLNKLENQGVLSEKTTFALDALLADCIIAFEEPIEQKELSLECDLAEFSVSSSAPDLEIIFNNLLSNAIKFTECGGSIAVGLEARGKNAVISVRDSGIGISPEDGARIFEKFYQADGSHASEGNGLGLPLVKRVIDMLGGEISVESELGKGSLFTVTLKDCVVSQ